MSKSSTRQVAQRKLDQASFHIDATGQAINSVHNGYEKHHPEIAEPLFICMKLLIEIQDIINKIRRSF